LVTEDVASVEEKGWVLHSIMKDFIASIEPLLYVIHCTRCLTYTLSFSSHHTPGKAGMIDYSHFTDEETEPKETKNNGQGSTH
jgi:hypothetical protein